MMKRLLIATSLTALLIFSVALARTLRLPASEELPVPADQVQVDVESISKKLSGAIAIRTISHSDPTDNDFAQWQELREFLEQSFPLVHQSLKRELVGGHSLLYEWRGTNPELPPILLLAHQDVVPIAPGTESNWTHPPFSGAIEGGYIWGRGALDDKGSMIAILEALESMIKNRIEPPRTILVAFGHDEEVGGSQGAKAVAKLLQERRVRAELILDEGGAVTEGVTKDITAPLALIGVAEKGYVTVEMSTKAPGGHSSMPPQRTAIGVMAQAIKRLEENPIPARLANPTREMLLTLAPKMAFFKRFVIANMDWFEQLLLRQMTQVSSTQASIRTTTAPTVFVAGERENVLPAEAKAIVNFRVLPGENSESVVNHVRHAINDDSITLKTTSAIEPSAVSSTDSPSYIRLKRAISRTFSGAVITPYLTVAGTDTKHYAAISDHIFRFLPCRMGQADLGRYHGTDERISASSLKEMVQFYTELLSMP